jgi:Zn ribbon nucleic-acid-binding protein
MAKKEKVLTFKSKTDYVRAGGNHCPYCGSEDITGSHMEVDGRDAWQEVTCTNCGRDWRDVYRLADVEASRGEKEEQIVSFFVKDTNEDTREYKSETEAVEAILASFAEDGVNPVDEVWCQNADDKTINLGVNWNATLTPQ